MHKYSEKLANLIRRKVGEGVDVNVVLEEVSRALSESNQNTLFGPALKRTIRILKRDLLSQTLIIETPFPLSDDSMQSISYKVSGSNNVNSNVILNTSLIAGFTAKYKGKYYDGSAKRYINKLMQK